MRIKRSEKPMVVRPMTTDDVFVLAQLWYDQTVFSQQFNPRLRIAPDAVERWSESAMRWCTDASCIALTATRDDDIAGCMVTQLVDNAPGLLPYQVAIVRDFTVDMHMPQSQQGIGSHLLRETRRLVIDHGVQQIQVLVNAYVTVEQAFWRAQGAHQHDGLFWFDL